jgi:hypothetical protein
MTSQNAYSIQPTTPAADGKVAAETSATAMVEGEISDEQLAAVSGGAALPPDQQRELARNTVK